MQLPRSLGITAKHTSAVQSPWRSYANVRSSGSLGLIARVGNNVSSFSEVPNDPEALLDKVRQMDPYETSTIPGKPTPQSEGISEGREGAAVTNDPWKSTAMTTSTQGDDSCYVVSEHDRNSQGYSPATISAMARLIGHDNSEAILAAGQSSVVMLPKTHIMAVLQASAATPLDDASAALALLCEAGQYENVVQYGTPLLRAAAAAANAPASSTSKTLPGPLGSLGSKPATSASPVQSPVPHLDLLVGDLALSLALAHINMAANVDSSGVASSGAGGGGRGRVGGAALEAAYHHLDTAIQVLERHTRVAPRLQHEVAACLQGVAVALAQDVLRTTHPVACPLDTTTAHSTNYTSEDGATTTAAATLSDITTSTTSTSTSTDAAQRRSWALTMLRDALWRPSAAESLVTHTRTHTASPDQHTTSSGPSMPRDTLTDDEGVATTTTTTSAVGGISSGKGGGGSGGGGGGGSGSWVGLQRADQRQELLAPLSGLMTAAEHIALYGPAASGQKPFYDTVQLSDQELYDLAVAHLAQGVTSGWPQHVLQALSYFERIAQQQQHQEANTNTSRGGISSNPPVGLFGTPTTTSSPGATRNPTTAALTSPPRALQPAAVDVSFERSVCEALLGRRTTAAAPVLYTAPAATASDMREAAASPGGSEGGEDDYMGSFYSDVDDEAALLRELEAHLEALAGRRPRAVAEDGYGDEDDEDKDGAVVYDKEGGGGARGEGDLTRRLGWAESWLALSVLPCFPETAAAAAGASEGGGGVSLKRWFSDPRVILFNKLLEVRSGPPAAAAALGSAIAHVSYASRQRLWQLWQAAAGAAVAAAAAAARSTAQPIPPPLAKDSASSTAKTSAIVASLTEADMDAAAMMYETGPGNPAAAAPLTGAALVDAAPLASRLLSQSRAALQEVAPRAAAAASAMAAAAAAVSSAAANSPQGRAVAAAASRVMVLPSFSLLPGWIPSGVSSALTSPPAAGSDSGGVGAAGLPDVTSDQVPVPVHDGPETHMLDNVPQTSNNVVPFTSTTTATANDVGGSNTDGGDDDAADRPAVAPSLTVMSESEPSSSASRQEAASATPADWADVSGTAPPSFAGTAAVVPSVSGDTADAADLLWVSDADGHLRPRMTARFVHVGTAPHLASASASAPVVDAVESRDAVRRVAAVAAQAACLGLLAAYVGHRIVTSGALQGGGGGSAVTMAADASVTRVASVARAVRQWMGSVGGRVASASAAGIRGDDNSDGGGGPPFASLSAVSAAQYGSLGSRRSPEPHDTLLYDKNYDTTSARIGTSGHGSHEMFDALTEAAALVRGWVATRALAPALSDPRDRVALLAALSEGRALCQAVAEADGHALLGRRVDLHRLQVTLEHIESLPHNRHNATSLERPAVQHATAPSPRPMRSDDVQVPTPLQAPNPQHPNPPNQVTTAHISPRQEKIQNGEEVVVDERPPLYVQVTAMVESSGTYVDRTAPSASNFARTERVRLTLCRSREKTLGRDDEHRRRANCSCAFSQTEVKELQREVHNELHALQGMETGAGEGAGQGADGGVGTAAEGYRWRVVAASRSPIPLYY